MKSVLWLWKLKREDAKVVKQAYSDSHILPILKGQKVTQTSLEVGLMP